MVLAGLFLGVALAIAFPAMVFLRSGTASRDRNLRRVVAMSPAELRSALEVKSPSRAAGTAADVAAMLTMAAQPPPDLDQRTAELWASVDAAIARGALSEEQMIAVAECAAGHARECIRRFGSCSTLPVKVLGDIASAGLMDDEDVGELFKRLMDDLEILGPTVVRPGDEVFLLPMSALSRLHTLHHDVRIGLTVQEVAIKGMNGTALPLVDPRPRGAFTFTGGGPRVTLPKAVVLEHVGAAELDVEVALLVDRATPQAFGGGGMSAPAPKRIPLRRMVHRVEVAPAQESLPRPLADPALVDCARSAIDIQLALAPDLDGVHHVVQATVAAIPLAECAMDFDVILELPGDTAEGTTASELRLGTFDVGQRAYEALGDLDGPGGIQPSWNVLSAWAPDSLVAAEQVTVRLEPAARWRIDARMADQRWSLPLVLEEHPIHRPQRGGGKP